MIEPGIDLEKRIFLDSVSITIDGDGPTIRYLGMEKLFNVEGRYVHELGNGARLVWNSRKKYSRPVIHASIPRFIYGNNIFPVSWGQVRAGLRSILNLLEERKVLIATNYVCKVSRADLAIDFETKNPQKVILSIGNCLGNWNRRKLIQIGDEKISVYWQNRSIISRVYERPVVCREGGESIGIRIETTFRSDALSRIIGRIRSVDSLIDCVSNPKNALFSTAAEVVRYHTTNNYRPQRITIRELAKFEHNLWIESSLKHEGYVRTVERFGEKSVNDFIKLCSRTNTGWATYSNFEIELFRGHLLTR